MKINNVIKNKKLKVVSNHKNKIKVKISKEIIK